MLALNAVANGSPRDRWVEGLGRVLRANAGGIHQKHQQHAHLRDNTGIHSAVPAQCFLLAETFSKCQQLVKNHLISCPQSADT